MIREKLFYTLNLGQAADGHAACRCCCSGSLQIAAQAGARDMARERMYFVSSVMILLGVLAMRWNVVIGGQLFSKSLRGVMSYKMEFAGLEGWFMGLLLLALPFVILTVLVKLFLSERLPTQRARAPPRSARFRLCRRDVATLTRNWRERQASRRACVKLFAGGIE